MACGCNKGRANGAVASAQSGTYRVIVSERQVYETSNASTADQVADRFNKNLPEGATPIATILAPGESA